MSTWVSHELQSCLGLNPWVAKPEASQTYIPNNHIATAYAVKKSQDLGNWLEIKLRGHLLKQFKQAILFQISIIHTYFPLTPLLSFYQYFQCLWEQVHIQISQWRKTSRENLRASWSWNCQSMSDILLFPSCNVWTVSESERYQQGEL